VGNVVDVGGWVGGLWLVWGVGCSVWWVWWWGGGGGGGLPFCLNIPRSALSATLNSYNLVYGSILPPFSNNWAAIVG
jgi:hypothetical protein